MNDITADKLRGLSEALQRVSQTAGVMVAWLTLPMVIGTFVIVVLRYAFGLGWIWMQEAVVWMHAVVFMLAASYTLKQNEHVRVDIFYRRLSPQGRALVDIVGISLLLLPVSIFIVAVSWDYVAVSWRIREGSREAGGLPYPFVPLLKSTIPLAAVLLLIEGAAQWLRRFLVFTGRVDSPSRPVAAGTVSASDS